MITFTYDASGIKLRKSINGTITQEYAGGIEYNEGQREAVYHSEGRVAFAEENSRYEYYLKDHLGNTRVVFSDLNNDGVLQPFNETGGSTPTTPDGNFYTELLQENHYYPFGMLLMLH